MSFDLIFNSIIFLFLVIYIILHLLRKKRISIKYSLLWLIPCAVLITFTIVPGLMAKISSFLGFQTSSNMIFASIIGFLMLISIALTVIVTNLKEKVKLLIQEVSLLKEKVDNEIK